jgi:hypothetical protein
MKKRLVLAVFLAVVVGVGSFFVAYRFWPGGGQTGAQEGTPVPTPMWGSPVVIRTPTPTPQPGVCPTPVRTTPADFAEPPAALAASEIPGQLFQGGASYSEGYVTVHLPAGREFVIASAWSQDESNLLISIYDVRSGSQLIMRGDGCEISRFVRDPAADAVFDETIRAVEISPTYVCPVPLRRGPEEDWPRIPESKWGGQRIEGGAAVDVAGSTLDLPVGRQFIVSLMIADPRGVFFSIYDVQTQSVLQVRSGDGCELARWVGDLAVEPIFDEIVRDLRATGP